MIAGLVRTVQAATLVKEDTYGDPWRRGAIVYKDPSHFDVEGLRNRFHEGIRILYGLSGKHWYLWDAMKLTHYEVVSGLDLDESKYIGVLYDYDRNLVEVSNMSDWSQKEVGEFLENDPAYCKLFGSLRDPYMELNVYAGHSGSNEGAWA